MRRMGIGLQMYTLRDETASDMIGTLRQAAKLGYEGVEFAGYAGLKADHMRELLQELGIQAIGSHVSLERLRNNLQEEIDYLRTIGGKYLVCPYVDEGSRNDAAAWLQVIASLQEIGAEVNRQGLQFAYHNHAFEFDVQVEDQFAFDALYSRIPASSVLVEMDVCWVQFAGQDPLAYIPKYAGRLPLLHLKDFTKDTQGNMVTLELGEGEVKLAEVIQAASDAGTEWLIVEQDHCQKPPIQSVSNSLEWVKRNYLQKI